MLIPAKKDSPRMLPKYERLQEERGGPLLSYPYRPQRLATPVRPEKRGAAVTGNQIEFFCGNATLAATVPGIYVFGLGLGTVFMEYNVPSGVVTLLDVPEEITMLNNAIAEAAISSAQTPAEEEVVEFRLTPPRVESIALLRDKVRLNKTAMDFVKGARAHAFRIEDVEDPSE